MTKKTITKTLLQLYKGALGKLLSQVNPLQDCSDNYGYLIASQKTFFLSSNL